MTKHIALLCAAGIGQRMNSSVPKQYLSLIYKNLEQTIIEITINKFLQHQDIDAVIVALNLEDRYFIDLNSHWLSKEPTIQEQYESGNGNLYKTNNPKLYYCFGFGKRFHTVYSLLANALVLTEQQAWKQHEVVVHIHDVARPGISTTEISKLVEQANHIYNFNQFDFTNQNINSLSEQLDDKVFGILPINRVVDTVRLIDPSSTDCQVKSTIDRNQVALALTPQSVNLVYYLSLLHNILELGNDLEYNQNKNLNIFPNITNLIDNYQSLSQFIKIQLDNSNIGYNKITCINDKCKVILENLTDDMGLLLHLNLKVNAIEFGKNNLKITAPDDLALAQFYLNLEAQ